MLEDLYGRTNGTTKKSVFIKNCFSKNMLILGTAHIGGFAACTFSRGTDFKVKYDAEFPKNPEAYFNKSVYPIMIENCYSIDSEVFSTWDDSGAFISCGSKLIARNCFTNNTIYASTLTGVFIGRDVSRDSGDLGLYDDKGNKSISAYFENCYTSGIIEGSEAIGGFIGYMNSTESTNAAVFKNCYSTSMVGMEYSGEYVGGFVGHDATKATEKVSLEIDNEIREFSGSTFINCYAAGEVGGINTDTENSATNTATIGGFIGSYTQIKSNFINCFYDKQTTGMRERGIGFVESNSNYSGQIEGITGVYTKGSSLENGTPGLTGKDGNIINMGDDSVWVKNEGLYPQLKVFTEATNWDTNQDMIKGYSQASASTIFLEHWDYIMTADDQTYNIQSEDPYSPTANAEENNYIYDTIRDITRQFEFTSKDNSDSIYNNIVWKIDEETNNSRGLIADFNIDYGILTTNVVGESEYNAPVLTIINPAKSTDNISAALYQQIQESGDTKDIYKCYEFAPGKSWVKIEITNDDGVTIGNRKLRLLPMSFIDAGNYTEISIDKDGNNKITYKNSNGEEFKYKGETYNHWLDTLYTTTSITNLGTSSRYEAQEVSTNPNTKFAMWGRYPEDEKTMDSTTKFDALYDQKMIGGASEGLTKVEVYKLDVEYEQTTLEDGQITQLPKLNYDNSTRITEESLDNEKWSGMVNFGLEDVGWYELKYYWRLNDGRYLYDSKIVVIQGENHTASIENVIQTKDDETEPQIVPDIKEDKNAPDDLDFSGTEFKEIDDNDDIITRSKEIKNFNSDEVILGWKNDSDYKLVNLEIEVSLDGVNWIPLVLELQNPDDPYNFINAKYTYYYQDYEMRQNPETKEFYLMQIGEPKEIITTLQSIPNEENLDYANYLYLSFAIKEDDNSIKNIECDTRVTAEFIPIDTHVIANKYVDKESVFTGDDVTYTVILEPDYYNDAFDINVSDIIPNETALIEDSVELGEYVEDTDTYIADKGQYSKFSYNNGTKELLCHYDKMTYGKKYYIKFKANVTAVVDKEKQDFIKVDNTVNFTYKKSESGSVVNGEQTKPATFIIIQDERVYLVIDKEVTTPNAPVENFKINTELSKDGVDIEKYKWYIDYEPTSETSSSIEINQDQIAMLVGTTNGNDNLDNANYKISEDLDSMPPNYYYSSITNDGEGMLEAGTVQKITVSNYYRRPTEAINVFFEKKDIDSNDYVGNAKMGLQKENDEGIYEDYYTWNTTSSHKAILLQEGKYRLLELEAPAEPEYQLNENMIYFEISKNDSGNLIVYKDGEEVADKKIVFYNERVKYDCTIKYYYNGIEDTEKEEHIKLPKDYIFSEYTEKIEPGYRLMTAEEGAAEGLEGLKDGVIGLPLTVTSNEEQNVVSVYYVLKDTKVTVKYLEKGTNKVINEKENYEINGKVFDEYQTEQKEFTGYNFVESTNNTKGTMTEDTIEVIYYYQLKDPTSEQNISKTATDIVENLSDQITYNIAYNAKIKDYMGNVEVRLVDTLPYEIDESKSDLAGGVYDENTHTLTWTENIEGINTYDNPESGEINITKSIKVVYKGINQETTNIENKVTGKVITKTPEKEFEEVEAKSNTQTNFLVSVPVSKVWEDDSDKLGQRPTKVVFKLHGSDGSEYTKELAKPGTSGTTTTQDQSNPNKWNDVFESLPKFDSNSQEIVYTLTEEEKTEGDLKYYDSVVTDKTVTNTNKYGKVIVHYYIMNTDGSTTTTRVPNAQGQEVQDIVIEGKEGDSYSTEEAKNINEKYELVAEKLPANATGNIEKYNEGKPQEVIYYYRLKPAKVLINYLEKDSNKVLLDQETITGYVDDSYNTNTNYRKEMIQKDGSIYTLVEDSKNTEGTMTVNQIEVTYYYILKVPTITNNITKTGTERITSANQEISYNVTYTAEVTDYIGDAEVTIVDTLPYEIDEEKSDLAGGTYDAASKTITWKENISDLDSFNEKGKVNITKTFKVVYVGLDMNQEKITNNVRGSIKLLAPEKTSEETTSSFETPIYKAIISSEKLVDKTEATEGEKVTYTIRIKNDGNLAKTVTVRDTLPAGITFDKDTLIQVGETGTVYTEQNLKNGIPVEVPAYGSIDVVFAGIVDELANNEYSKTLTNQATIDNEPTNEVTTNVTKANITAHKDSDPTSGNKVREGDEITYRIKVRNDGTRAGDVIVKDTIPAGTTFVEGSIKIDNVADSTKTATDLANGISVTVGVDKEVVVEFKVKVNKQIDGTKIKNTAYINQNGEDKKVPEEPEHTYVEPKEEQSISKNGTATIESLDQEITYNISYTARITDYRGRAAVKLVDKLPYAIDEAKSDLAGGTYDAQAQTITWEETVEDIQLTEEKEVTINKIIKVVYTGINQGTTAIKNIVTGQIEYETPVMTSDEVTANSTTTTGFTVNVPVSKVWEDDSNKLGQRPTKVVFKLHGSDRSEYTLELAKPGTQGSTTTQDSTNPNKWNDIFENLPKYDSNNQEIVYTLTEEEKTEGDLKYYDSVVTDKTITNTNKYGKVTVHHYIMNTDGSTTTTRVPDTNGTEIADVVIEGKEGNPYTTEEAKNINEKYELVEEKLPANATGTIEKYNEEKPQEVIYYYRLKPSKVLINYLEKDSNEVLSTQERITGYVDNSYNTNIDHRKETIQKDGKTYTLVKDSGNTDGIMTVADTTVTYYYLQNTKATVRYVERDPETGDIVKDLEEPTVKEGLVGDKFVTNEKAFIGYKLVEEPEHKTINMTKEEQTLIYYYEPVYTGLIENHIDDKTGKILETETHEIQVGENYNIPSKEFEGYDLVEEKLPANAEGTMGEEVVTVNYYYIKKAVLEVNYIDIYTNKPLIGQIVDNTKHEGDLYTTEQKTFENYDLVEVPSNASGTMVVEIDEEGNITNNRTVVTYYYTQRAIVEEHHIDILTGKDIEEPTIHNGHVGDEYDIPSKEFLSYQLIEEDEEGNSMLPTNSQGIMTAEKIVVNYYYNQPAKVIVHYVEKATGKELEETNLETGELQSSQVIIDGQIEDDYKTEAKEFLYYTLVERPDQEEGKMKVEITKDENGNDIVNNTIELYYYYEAKPFNIGVEKEITGIIVNGERREPTNGKLEKVEIYRKSTEETSVQVEYKIKVSNTGEVSGNATIEENIPEGMRLANNDGTWEEQEGKLIKVIPEIGAGETKEYTVLLNWEQSGNNMGEKANEVKLVETGNVPGFVDNNDKDNTSNANVIISVETGELPIGLILALVGLIGLETITLRYAVVLTKRQKRSKKQNVTKK